MDNNTDNFEILKDFFCNSNIDQIMDAIENENNFKRAIMKKYPNLSIKKINELSDYYILNHEKFFDMIILYNTLDRIDPLINICKEAAKQKEISLSDLLMLLNYVTNKSIDSNTKSLLYFDDDEDDY